MSDEPQPLDGPGHNCWAIRDLRLVRMGLIELRKRLSSGYERFLPARLGGQIAGDLETATQQFQEICLALVAERDAALAREEVARKLLAEALAKAPPTEEPPTLTVLAYQELTSSTAPGVSGHQLRVCLKWGDRADRELVLPGIGDQPPDSAAILDGVRRALDAALASPLGGSVRPLPLPMPIPESASWLPRRGLKR